MPRPSVKAERTEEILDAFERCVALYGVEGSTLERIAEAAGLRRSLLRHYLGNREDLLQALVERFLAQSARETELLFASLPKRGRAAKLIDYLFDETYADTQAILVADALVAASAHRPELAPKLRKWTEDFAARIAEELGRSFPAAKPAALKEVAAGVVGIFFTVDSLAPLGPMPRFRAASKAAAQRLVSSLGPKPGDSGLQT